jgi:hypothetical protein
VNLKCPQSGDSKLIPIRSVVHDPEDSMAKDEISHVLAAMQTLFPWNIPSDILEDLDAWERKNNQFSIDNFEKGIEDVFRELK